jgi:esterase/lipase superfamily enzyme
LGKGKGPDPWLVVSSDDFERLENLIRALRLLESGLLRRAGLGPLAVMIKKLRRFLNNEHTPDEVRRAADRVRLVLSNPVLSTRNAPEFSSADSLGLGAELSTVSRFLLNGVTHACTRAGRALDPASLTELRPAPAYPNKRVLVFFATDRKRESSLGELALFANERDGHLQYGVAAVSIPPGKIHHRGRIERPQMWKLEFSEDERWHVVITSCSQLSEPEWGDRARLYLSSADEQSALVYIHGFNVTFPDAIRRCAQIAYDIQFPGLITAFSWSSKAAIKGYVADLDNAELAADPLSEFLLKLKLDIGVSSVHVLAHSMGNRTLLGAIKKIPGLGGLDTPVREAVMAAPDVDARILRQQFDEVGPKALRWTLYGSENDRALRESKRIRAGVARAGDGGENIFVAKGIDTVDASAVGADLFGLGHSYFATNRTLLSDIYYVVNEHLPVVKRDGLEPRTRERVSYWAFLP